MLLCELLRAYPPVRTSGPLDVVVKNLRHDSREVKDGDIFFAIPGSKTDGNRHAQEALKKGAIAIVSELDWPPPPTLLPGSWIQVADVSEAMGRYADEFFSHPSGALKIIGVTGTNGKTTTTYFLESIVAKCGGRAGVAGTIEYRLGGKRLAKAANTTPIALELTRLLSRFREGGATHGLLEVSSHALALKRVETVDFDAAVFLNLTRDHLDFHKTVEEYFEAKARLIDLLARPDNRKSPKVAALNFDDPRASRLVKRAIGCEIVSFGIGEGKQDLKASILSADLNGSRFVLDWKGRRHEASIRLAGPHNVSNATAAAAAMLGLGIPIDQVVAGLASLAMVPGRLESVDEGQNFHVFVDFAHTDSALETILRLIASLPHRKIITVFGCGGDRDKTKRGPMGVAAAQGSDFVFVTSDNPRTETPSAIMAEIEQEIRAAARQNYKLVEDRGKAIAAAIHLARKGDVVLIAGKGHEDYQILSDRTIPFDDREAARTALRSL